MCKKKKVYILLIVFLSLVGIVFLLLNLNKTNFKKKIYFYSDASIPSFISIENPNKNTVNFNFTLNGYFYSSLHDFYRRNSKPYKSDFEKVTSVFNTFINSFVHEKLFNEWGDLPLIRLNSTGFAICGKQSEILSQIYFNYGFPAHVIHLNGHAVCEVYYNKTWHLLDPDRKTFFSHNNELFGYNHILQNPEIIKECGNKSYLANLTLFSKKYTQFFLSQYDNQIQEINQINNDTFLLMLPSGSKFIFPYNPDIFVDFYPYNTKAKLVLRKGYRGYINNPLVLIDAEGKGLITINKQSFCLPEQRELFKATIYTSKKFINKVYVQVFSDSLSLVYMLNPLFCNLSSKNILMVNASDSLNIRIYKQEKQKQHQPTHIELLNKFTPYAFLLQKNIVLDNINTFEDLYNKFLKNYCIEKNLDTSMIKWRLQLIKPLIDKPLNFFSDESIFYAYLAVILHAEPHEFKNLFLFEYKKFMYKKIISYYNNHAKLLIM